MLRVNEAAKRIGISASKLYQLIDGRQLSFYRVGGKILLAETDVDAYLASCRVGAVAPVATAPRARIKLKHLRLS
jgi:excisionase family DNA binding protein